MGSHTEKQLIPAQCEGHKSSIFLAVCHALLCLKLGNREWFQYRILENRAGIAEKEEGNKDPFTSFFNTC